jgi:hypothetical protein
VTESAGLGLPDVRLVVYKEILGGDLRKFRAESHDSPTGGGARDLRLRPHSGFAPIFARMFPGERIEYRRRNGIRVQVRIAVGAFHWQDEETGVHHQSEATYWPPTSAREGEGRISVVYTYPPLTSVPPRSEGRIVLILLQRRDFEVWPYLRTEASLSQRPWHSLLAGPILECLNAPRRRGSAARGFIDFETEQRQCYG